MKITREMLIEECCCYADTPGKLERYVPVDGITPLQVCDADVSVDDKLWCLVRKYGDYQPLTNRQYRLLACKWAREACELTGWDDARSMHAIDVAERYAEGLADKDELAAVEAAARSAAWEAAMTAGSLAAGSAREAAWAGALEAAAGSAAAAEAAAWSAAWEAAPDARAEAQDRHLADIRAVLTGDLFAEGKS